MKTAVVTGISKGIGLAIAKKFSEAGFHVIGCASSANSVAHVRATEPHLETYQVDVGKMDELCAFVDSISTHHKKIDVLVNNAGKYLPGTIQTEAEGTFDEMIRVNLSSVYHLTRLILPLMVPNRSGHIINICSTASVKAYPNGGSYCIAKHGLLGLTRVLREELKPEGIRVTALLPGPTLTDSWKDSTEPTERFITADDIAELAWCAHSLSPGAVIEELLIRPQLGDLG
jgi:NADP-dependent 3-hydroxy acid dehydrogenase YdfG